MHLGANCLHLSKGFHLQQCFLHSLLPSLVPVLLSLGLVKAAEPQWQRAEIMLYMSPAFHLRPLLGLHLCLQRLCLKKELERRSLPRGCVTSEYF